MTKEKIIKKIILILLFFPCIALAQTNKEIATDHLNKLKNGVLLVRLKTSENKVNALKKAGRDKEAEEIIKKQYLENQKIYAAFKTAYHFSPGYFFYSSSSNEILRENYKGSLLNEKLEVDSVLNVTASNIYISEFDNTQGTGFFALVIKNQKYELLVKPFPFYVKGFDFLPVFRKPIVDMVYILNGKLNKAI